MGFRTDSYATVWSVEQVSDTKTKGRITISRKNRQTGEYEQDFSGFVDFIGTAAAKKAATLKERDRIKLKDIDVSTNFVQEKGVTYTNFKIFSFETQDEMNGTSPANTDTPQPRRPVDEGEIDDSRLPF